VTPLGPPGDLRHRFAGAQDQARLPLDPESAHLERAGEDTQRPQGECVVTVESEGASEAFLELPFVQSLVAGTQGEQLLVRVRPESPNGRTMRVQAAPAEYRREGRVRPQAPREPDQITPDGDGDTEKHRHVERGPRYRHALPRYVPGAEDVVEQDDGGRNGDKESEADQGKSREPSDGRGTGRGQTLPRHPLFVDLERCCVQLLHAYQYTHIPRVENGLEITRESISAPQVSRVQDLAELLRAGEDGVLKR